MPQLKVPKGRAILRKQASAKRHNHLDLTADIALDSVTEEIGFLY